MYTSIIGFAGKKKSGKDTAASLLYYDKSWIPGFDKNRLKLGFEYYARPLKELCRDFYGISEGLLWGTDDDKNRLTSLKWEDLPHYGKICGEIIKYNADPKNSTYSLSEDKKKFDRVFHGNYKIYPTGFMTVREVLQQIGEMLRSIDPTCYERQLKKNIESKDLDICFVTDVRKPSEVDLIKSMGGTVVKITRDIYQGQDQHISETALDPENYDQSNFDFICDNHEMTLDEFHKDIIRIGIEINS